MANAPRNKKRIGIDARFYGPVGKGLGRYTEEIVDNIIKIDPDNEYIIFLSKENFKKVSDPAHREGRGGRLNRARVKKVLTPVKWYSLVEQILMPFYIWREKLDLIHFPHFNVPIFCPIKFIVTIHDLILTKFPTQRATTLGPFFYRIKNLAYKFVIWSAIRRAKKIIAVSRFTKDDIIKHFKIKQERIVVTYEGVANLSKGGLIKKDGDKKTFLGYNIDSPFLLYAGNAYPHKNLEGLVKIFKKIIQGNNFKYADLRLVLVGKEDYFYKRIKKYAEKLNLWKERRGGDSVIFPGYLPDAELKILYKNALAYVFPSFYEGFGLPPLEAMARGCPVISSNKASMPEILGDAAIYFNPENEDEMQARIEKVLKDKDLRDALINRGYERVKKYSWKRCAQGTLVVYKDVLC